jgi:hypothetical protein
MPEGIDAVAGMFGRELAPQTPPVDQKGQPLSHSEKPESMFSLRPIEGDSLTGDTRDGGDDSRLRARERELADGDEEGTRGRGRRQSVEDSAKGLQRSSEDEGWESEETESEVDSADQPIDAERQEQELLLEDEGEKHPIVIDGKQYAVSVPEALRGYIRQVTFHQRLEQLKQQYQQFEASVAQLNQNWADWQKAKAEYEEDLGNLIPPEPNWDQEFAANPAGARNQQKIYQIMYAKLAQSRQARAEREEWQRQEADRQLQNYAVNGYNKFVTDHIKFMPDEPTLTKNVQSMHRTASSSGFSAQEIATVFDPRMLDILWKASKYDRMQANKPKPVIVGKGRTLTPGAATPLSGNARRKGLDDAQRQLASSGRLDDAADVFRRLL